MESLIHLIPGWDSKVSGLQFGLLVAIVVIFLLGMAARQIIINLMPKLLKSFGDEKEAIKAFELKSQTPIGAAAAGFLAASFVEEDESSSSLGKNRERHGAVIGHVRALATTEASGVE